MSDGWICHNCRSRFAEPSFSEGPKTKDPETGVESVRFEKSRLLCPVCLSPHIDQGPRR